MTHNNLERRKRPRLRPRAEKRRELSMPILFRCAYCNQLMKIGRRKAGSVVKCPKCANQIVVPAPKNGEEDIPEHPGRQAASNPQGDEGGLFERSDFEKLFDQVPAAGPQLLHQPTPRPAAAHSGPAVPSPEPAEYDAVPLDAGTGSPARGIFLTSGVLAVVCALGVVLLGMAFFLGLLLGRSSQP